MAATTRRRRSTAAVAAVAASAALASSVPVTFAVSRPEQRVARLTPSQRGPAPISAGWRPAATARAAAANDGPQVKSTRLNDAVRNLIFIGVMAGTVAGSWWFTGKWWKLPLFFALPSMAYRLWITRMDTEKLAQVSASVDMKYVATSEKEQKELHSFMCSQCGYTLFPARGREAAFFTPNFKCPMCGAAKSEFVDMSDDSDGPVESSPAPEGQNSTPAS